MSPSIAWQWIHFVDLTPSELYALLTARGEVFVVEQRCAFLDMDGLDRDSMHLLGWAPRNHPADRDRALAAYLRLVEPEGTQHGVDRFAEVLGPAANLLVVVVLEGGQGLGAAWMGARDGQERVLTVLPMFHVYGLMTGLIQPIFSAAAVILTTRFDAAHSLRQRRIV